MRRLRSESRSTIVGRQAIVARNAIWLKQRASGVAPRADPKGGHGRSAAVSRAPSGAIDVEDGKSGSVAWVAPGRQRSVRSA